MDENWESKLTLYWSPIFFWNQSLLNGNLLNSHYNLDSIFFFTVMKPDAERGLFTGMVGEEALEPSPPQDRSQLHHLKMRCILSTNALTEISKKNKNQGFFLIVKSYLFKIQGLREVLAKQYGLFCTMLKKCIWCKLIHVLENKLLLTSV